MSEATAEEQQPKLPFEHETRQPFDLSDELKARVDASGLAETVAHAQAESYGYIYDPACTEYTHEGGATKVVPGSHLLRRHPTPEEVAAEEGVISTACPAGTIVFWNGSIWHGGGTRTIDGERVVAHITFSRLAMRPMENYDFLGDDWLEGKPYEMRVMLGREDFLNKGGTMAEMDKIANTMNWSKT